MPVDPAVILRRLGVPEAAAIEPVSGGADALLWMITTDDHRYALRVLRGDQRDQAEREVTIYRSLADTEIPVPDVPAAALDTDPPAYLMDWVDGQTLADVLLDPATSAVIRHRLMIDFGRLQRMINELTGPDLSDRRPDWIARRSTDSDLELQLRGLRSGERRLLHLDYHPLNVLVRDDRIVAVLDWANATLGDPRYDRARTESIMALYPDPTGQLAPLLAEAIDDWRTRYGADRDLEPEFRRWAGMAMLSDLSPRIGDPASPWLTDDHVARIRSYP